MRSWPEWWSWDLELSLHLLDRMIDRGFNETDLRIMLDEAESCDPNHEPGRWVIVTRHNGRRWEVIVEPEFQEQILIIVTAYPVS